MKKFLAVLLTTTAMFYGAVSKSNAATCTWNGTQLTITGSGSETFTGCSDGSNHRNATEVTFSSGITSVGNNAFSNSTSLKSVSLGGVTSVGYNAFSGATSLNNVSMPNVTSIGSSAFYNASSLTSVEMPKVQRIESSAFGYNQSLAELNLPSSLTYVGGDAFWTRGEITLNVAGSLSGWNRDALNDYGSGNTTFRCTGNQENCKTDLQNFMNRATWTNPQYFIYDDGNKISCLQEGSIYLNTCRTRDDVCNNPNTCTYDNGITYKVVDAQTVYAFNDDGDVLLKMSCSSPKTDCTAEYYDGYRNTIAKYDDNGKPVRAYDYADDGSAVVYDDQCRVIDRLDPYGNSIYGLKYICTSPDSCEIFRGENKIGNISCTNKTNCLTQFYDADGNVIAEYDDNGKPVNAYDYADDGSTLVYDDQCRVKERLDPYGNSIYGFGDTLLSDNRRTRYTPAEAAEIVGNNEDNMIVMYFK